MENKLYMLVIGICVLIIFIILSIVIQLRRERKIKRRMQYYYGKWRETEYSDEVLSFIAEYTNANKKMIDDITWNDLNMDNVFQKMNHTWSFAGEDYLYYLLHIPEHSLDQEAMILYFQEHERQRVNLQMIFAGIGKYHGASVYFLQKENGKCRRQRKETSLRCI